MSLFTWSLLPLRSLSLIDFFFFSGENCSLNSTKLFPAVGRSETCPQSFSSVTCVSWSLSKLYSQLLRRGKTVMWWPLTLKEKYVSVLGVGKSRRELKINFVVVHFLSFVWLLADPMSCNTPAFSVLHYPWVCSDSCPFSQW